MQEACQTDPSRQKTFPAALYRALISVLLRAASSHDATAANEVLVRALSLPLETPGACFGFTSMNDSGKVAAVLTNLVVAAARDEPLLQTGPALSLYGAAGPGVGDVDEFHNATPDHRAEFADTKERLEDVRSGSVALAIQLYAIALENEGEKAEFLKASVLHHAPFLAAFTETLPMSVGHLCPKLRQALARLYAAYMKGQTEAVREDIRTRLVNSFMRLAVDQPGNLGLYVFSVTAPEIRMSACRVCLIQRFGVRDRIDNAFSLSLLMSRYLTITPTKGRANAAVPPLLAGLIMGWFEIAQASDFYLVGSGERREADVRAKLLALRKAMLRRASSFGASKKDVATLKVAVMALANRIVESNSQV